MLILAMVWAGSRKDPKQVPLFGGREIRAAKFTASIFGVSQSVAH
jgi:hypothetical protein